MSTDPLSAAIGRSEPAQPAAPVPGPQDPAPGTASASPAQEPAAPSYEAPAAGGATTSTAPDPERSLLERRPEILVGAAFAGGFIAAQLLGRARRR